MTSPVSTSTSTTEQAAEYVKPVKESTAPPTVVPVATAMPGICGCWSSGLNVIAGTGVSPPRIGAVNEATRLTRCENASPTSFCQISGRPGTSSSVAHPFSG